MTITTKLMKLNAMESKVKADKEQFEKDIMTATKQCVCIWKSPETCKKCKEV